MARAVANAFALGLMSASAFGSSAGERGPEVVVIDAASSPYAAIRSVEQVPEPAFRRFVELALAALEADFSGPARLGGAGAAPALRIVRIPLVAARPEDFAPPAAPSGEGCVVTSPWAELTVDGRRGISGVFYWSERQILLDQAVLAGVADGGRAPRRPLARAEFDRMVNAYADANILRTTDAPPQLPPDLGWLLRTAPKSTLAPFEAMATRRLAQVLGERAPFYARLFRHLYAGCFDAPVGAVFEFSGVAEISFRD